MISRRLLKTVLRSSVPRLLSEQTHVLPQQCRHCCLPNAQLHTTTPMPQEMVLVIPTAEVDKVEKGSNIKDMETQTGANICVERSDTNDHSKCVISGSEESITKAKRMIDECIGQTKELVLDIPKRYTRMVVRQNQMEKMMKETGSTIKLDKTTAGDVVKCIITGSEEAVASTRVLIEKNIKAVQELVLDIPKRHAYFVLTLKQRTKMTKKTGSTITLDRTTAGDVVKCIITGSEETVASTRVMIEKNIKAVQELVLDIPKRHAHFVFTEKRRREMMETTGSKIQLDMTTAGDDVKCIITGSEEAVASTRVLIEKNIKAVQNKDSQIEPKQEKKLPKESGIKEKSLVQTLKKKGSVQKDDLTNQEIGKQHKSKEKDIKVKSLVQTLKMKGSVQKDDLTNQEIGKQHQSKETGIKEKSLVQTLKKKGSVQKDDLTNQEIGKQHKSREKGIKEKSLVQTLKMKGSIQKDDLTNQEIGKQHKSIETDSGHKVVSLLLDGDTSVEKERRKRVKKRPEKTEKEGFTVNSLVESLKMKRSLQEQKEERAKKRQENNEGREVVIGKSKWDMLMMKAEKEKPLEEFFEVKTISAEKEITTDKSLEAVAKDLNVKPRPPVVTIMGHVDHGKTTLLDALRKSNVVSQEFGGITQHIGAFEVRLKSGHSITFLDTPGHAAFSNMRSRGASVTDVIVLVVAAEDGIMNQTLESINHAKRANVPVIVAINKIDHPNANPDRIKYQLSEYGLVPEELGGDVQVIPISALKKQNLDKLQESIIVQMEVLDLKANTSGNVEGSVIEAKIDVGRGRQVTTLIRSGTLRKGDYLIAGSSFTKVRIMLNDQGKVIKEAKPGTPVVVTGWETLPSAGDRVQQIKNEVEARSILEEIKTREREDLMAASAADATAEERRKKLHEDYLFVRKAKKDLHWREMNALRTSRKGDVIFDKGVITFPVILKADVDGSLEVLEENMHSFHSEYIDLSIVSSGVGDINKGDLELAESSGARIYGFNVKQSEVPDKKYDVPVSLNNVIYSLFDELVEDMQSQMPTYVQTEETGRAQVLDIFDIKDNIHKVIKVAGCRCRSGTLNQDGLYKVERNNEVIHEGRLVSLKVKSKDVVSVKEGKECGLGFENSVELKQGDEIICMSAEEKRRKLEWNHPLKHEKAL